MSSLNGQTCLWCTAQEVSLCQRRIKNSIGWMWQSRLSWPLGWRSSTSSLRTTDMIAWYWRRLDYHICIARLSIARFVGQPSQYSTSLAQVCHSWLQQSVEYRWRADKIVCLTDSLSAGRRTSFSVNRLTMLKLPLLQIISCQLVMFSAVPVCFDFYWSANVISKGCQNWNISFKMLIMVFWVLVSIAAFGELVHGKL